MILPLLSEIAPRTVEQLAGSERWCRTAKGTEAMACDPAPRRVR